ncbi:MAG: FecR domain-containing protein [Staphylococcus sp.]|nr:FecR domain-containing protein [Staphylococcus sp.]
MEKENRHLKFVLRHYVHGAFDTRRAIGEYRQSHPTERRVFRIILRTLTTAAALAILTTLGYYLFIAPGKPVVLYAGADSATYTLPDSSEVVLYPHSTVSYRDKDFGKDGRRVEMAGKVRFTVTRKPEAPFVATTGRGAIRVLGTQFTIDAYESDSIGVSVSSGKVLFTPTGESEGLVLTQGMSACLLAGHDRPELLGNNNAADNDNTAGTGNPHFIFDATPLTEVLARLSGHFNVELTCADGQGKTLTAEFDGSDLNEIITIIEKSLGVKIERKPRK